MPAELDCLTCGICCMEIQKPKGYRVILRPNDSLEGIPPECIVRIPVAKTGYNAIKLKTNEQGLDVCALLEGKIGESVSCTIHPTKPKACKDFIKGGATCLFYRNRLSTI